MPPPFLNWKMLIFSLKLRTFLGKASDKFHQKNFRKQICKDRSFVLSKSFIFFDTNVLFSFEKNDKKNFSTEFEELGRKSDLSGGSSGRALFVCCWDPGSNPPSSDNGAFLGDEDWINCLETFPMTSRMFLISVRLYCNRYRYNLTKKVYNNIPPLKR